MAKVRIYCTLKSITPSGNRKISPCTVISITADMEGPFIHQTSTRPSLCMHILSLSSKRLLLKNNNKDINDESRRHDYRKNE
jgi:hypothetical protein